MTAGSGEHRDNESYESCLGSVKGSKHKRIKRFLAIRLFRYGTICKLGWWWNETRRWSALTENSSIFWLINYYKNDTLFVLSVLVHSKVEECSEPFCLPLPTFPSWILVSRIDGIMGCDPWHRSRRTSSCVDLRSYSLCQNCFQCTYTPPCC